MNTQDCPIEKLHRLDREFKAFCDVCTCVRFSDATLKQAEAYRCLGRFAYANRPENFEAKVDDAIENFGRLLSRYRVKYVGSRLVSVKKIQTSV